MICVSIGRGRHRHMMAEHRHLVEQGAELVEYRLDYISGEVNVKRLLTDRPGPVLVACRRERDGGKWNKSEEQRLMLLRTAIAEGVEFIDLEDDIAGSIPRFGKTKRVVSLHDFRKTPDDLDAIYQRLAESDPDIVKICTMANHPRDNLRMLEMVDRAAIPTIGLCMGDIGIPSRILCGKFGSPFTYATFHHERALAPGQLSFQQMTEIYRFDDIHRETDVYGVIADPVGHSLSPLIHNAAFAQAKLDKVYVPFRVLREDLDQFIDDAPRLDIRGLSVTIPHKESVVAKLTQADGAVRGIGAANTVVFRDGERLGYNTDYRAAIDSLEESMGVQPAVGQETESESSSLKDKTALVLGSGGVGMAIAFGLARRGARVVVADGVAGRAADLARRLDCRQIDWTARHSVTPDLLVNCTPVGMHPNVDETPFDKHYLRPAMVVFDAVYNPENTLLIKQARQQHCRVVTGLDMFVRQACLQFKLFTGRDGPAELMRSVIKRAIGAVKV